MFKTIARNASYLLSAQSVVKVISFFYNLFLIKSLGVADFGLYITALSYFSLVSSICDFGVNQYLIRESSINPAKLPTILSHITLLRLTATSLSFGALALILNATDPNSLRVSLSLLAILAVVPQSAALSLDSAFVALQKLSLSAFGYLVLSLVTTLTGMTLIFKGEGPFAPVIGLITGELFFALINALNLTRLKVSFRTQVTKDVLKEVVIGGLPYGILAVLGLLYFKVDTLLLTYLKGAYATGIYGAGYKFLEALVFIPTSICTALFPVLSNLSVHEPKKVYQVYKKATVFLFGLSLLAVVAYWLILPVLIINFFPSYLSAIPVIHILSLTIPFLFMIQPQALVFLSNRRLLRSLMIISLFNVALNVVLNIIFIPHYTYMASAVITVISDVIGFYIFFIFIRQHFSKL